jgi:sugar lactone lactonase YvrE
MSDTGVRVMNRRLIVISTLVASLIVVLGFVIWHYDRKRVDFASFANHAHTFPPETAFPTGVAVDASGNLYVVIEKQNRVLRVSPSHHITVAAGNGSRGFSGDGGPASQASLDAPVGIALDMAGNLFIADTDNNRVRRVDAKTNIITTVAGNGSLKGGWVGKLATSSELYQPVSVALDKDDDLYIGETLGAPIRRVDAITHILTMVIGAGLPGAISSGSPATGPFWVALDDGGTLFYADQSRNAVSQFNAEEGDGNVIAGSAVCGFAGDGGSANGALLCFPEAIALHKKQLFIADTGNNRIRKVDLSTGLIETVAGNGRSGYTGDGGPAVRASLHGPMGVAVDNSGGIYIADTGNGCVRYVNPGTGVITTRATARDIGLAR